MRILFLFFSLLLLSLQTLRANILHVGQGQVFQQIRPALAAAQAYDTLLVHAGFYQEGNLEIVQPLTLLGMDYPILDGGRQFEVLTVKSSDVCIRGFQIQYSGRMATIDLAGIKVLAVNRVRIEENRVYQCYFGIYLSGAQDCVVRANDVHGTPLEEQNTGNGIHLWKCERAHIEWNYLTGHRDGIYFEFVTDSKINNNFSENNIRYGLHFMFSHKDQYLDNRFRKNGAGVAVMYSREVQMHRNLFEYNWGGAAYGLLLKDISDSHIEHNRFEHNTAGIYLEGASRIRVLNNDFLENGWALRVQASCDANVFSENNFVANSFDVATNGHLVLNEFNGNYWDRYEGYDLNHDQVGDVPFRPVSLYAVVVEQMPYGLMLMRSFMVYLLDKAEKIVPSLTPEKLQDEAPLMNPLQRPAH